MEPITVKFLSQLQEPLLVFMFLIIIILVRVCLMERTERKEVQLKYDSAFRDLIGVSKDVIKLTTILEEKTANEKFESLLHKDKINDLFTQILDAINKINK